MPEVTWSARPAQCRILFYREEEPFERTHHVMGRFHLQSLEGELDDSGQEYVGRLRRSICEHGGHVVREVPSDGPGHELQLLLLPHLYAPDHVMRDFRART